MGLGVLPEPETNQYRLEGGRKCAGGSERPTLPPTPQRSLSGTDGSVVTVREPNPWPGCNEDAPD